MKNAWLKCTKFQINIKLIETCLNFSPNILYTTCSFKKEISTANEMTQDDRI